MASRREGSLSERYGPWALIAGASEGLGAAFARALAVRGVNLVLVARRPAPLEALARTLRDELGVEVRTVPLDLARSDLADALRSAVGTLEVGIAIYNAAYVPVGDFVETSAETIARVVDVDVRGPLLFAHVLAPPMVARRRGALVFMSSLAGLQGTPRLSTYAASKAFVTIFAESLWGELRGARVDVVVSCAGAIRTPGYAGAAAKEAPGTLDADVVAERTLAALGGGPRVVPGFVNAIASWIVGRLMPRRLAVAVMAASTQDLK